MQLTAKTTYCIGNSMGKLQPRPIEIFNRADSFSECTRKPSCVKIRTYHSGALAQSEGANDEDGPMLLRLGYDISFLFLRQSRWW